MSIVDWIEESVPRYGLAVGQLLDVAYIEYGAESSVKAL
jgi:hypothetical protein